LRAAGEYGDGERQQQETHSPEPNPNDRAPAFYTAERGGASNRAAGTRVAKACFAAMRRIGRSRRKWRARRCARRCSAEDQKFSRLSTSSS
jgi:hypothetical protein